MVRLRPAKAGELLPVGCISIPYGTIKTYKDAEEQSLKFYFNSLWYD